MILAPYKRKIVDEEREEETFDVSNFGVGTVFDVSQTDGPSLPEPLQVVFVPYRSRCFSPGKNRHRQAHAS